MSLLDNRDLIIFDCDGVLVDSELLAVEAFVEVMNEAGVPVTTAMVEQCFGMKQADILLRMAEVTGKDIPDGVAERLWPATRRVFERGLKAMPGVEAFIAATEGCKRCVASSSNPERIEVSLALTSLKPLFGAAVFSSHQVARGKPAPDLFLFAAASMGVDPRRCLVIEDSKYGIAGARAAGMMAVGFTGGSHSGAGHADELEAAGAGLVAASWDELLGRIPA
jgi:HAD superfamily hydrolase (TIGR01509 family)